MIDTKTEEGRKKMRIKKKAAAILVGAVCMMLLPITAFGETVDYEESSLPSVWAQHEVEAAISMGLVPAALQSDYKQVMTNTEFNTLADMLHGLLRGGVMRYLASAGSDAVGANRTSVVMSAVGIVNKETELDESLTREQAAVMLARLAEAIGNTLPRQALNFTDVWDITPQAIADIGRVYGAGLMDCNEDNEFLPNEAYTREQGIVSIFRLYNIAAGKTLLYAPPQIATLPIFPKQTSTSVQALTPSPITQAAFIVQTTLYSTPIDI